VAEEEPHFGELLLDESAEQGAGNRGVADKAPQPCSGRLVFMREVCGVDVQRDLQASIDRPRPLRAGWA